MLNPKNDWKKLNTRKIQECYNISVSNNFKSTIMTYRFTTIITEQDKLFVARCLELGVVSQGKSIEESQKNLKEAVQLFLEDEPNPKKYQTKSYPIVTTMEFNNV
jgi:predicted RNase H-like HicB family nuclease